MDLFAGTKKETICKLHNIGLVNCSHFLTIEPRSIIKCKFGDAARLFGSNDLQAFHHTLYYMIIDILQ